MNAKNQKLLESVGEHGRIFRRGKKVIIQARTNWLPEGVKGLNLLNPGALGGQRVFERVFERRAPFIYLPDQLAEAMAYLDFPNSFISSMNGYSNTAELITRYGIPPGMYERRCEAMYSACLEGVRRKFSYAQYGIVDGAAPFGVDAANRAVAIKFRAKRLSFSCPSYMLLVDDEDESPIYVAPTSDDYADAYVKPLDLLISTGGREQALRHDVYFSCLESKRILFVDVTNMIDPGNICVPATRIDEQGRIRIENAAAAMNRNVGIIGYLASRITSPDGGDQWDGIFNALTSEAVTLFRRKNE